MCFTNMDIYGRYVRVCPKINLNEILEYNLFGGNSL